MAIRIRVKPAYVPTPKERARIVKGPSKPKKRSA